MQRRRFLTSCMALIASGATTGLYPSVASAEPLDYIPGLLDARLAAGQTVFLEFTASWCTTCHAQQRVIQALQKETPAYLNELTFISVDWDRYGRSNLVRRLKVPRRSTLMILKGEEEHGRIIAQTSRRKIKALLDRGLDVARE